MEMGSEKLRESVWFIASERRPSSIWLTASGGRPGCCGAWPYGAAGIAIVTSKAAMRPRAAVQFRVSGSMVHPWPSAQTLVRRGHSPSRRLLGVSRLKR